MEEGGSSLAWRLLSTLEAGSLVLAGAALLAHAAHARLPPAVREGGASDRSTHPQRVMRPRKVLVTDPSAVIGRVIVQRLECAGCAVSTMMSDASSGAGEAVDALVVVGAEAKAGGGLEGLSGLVSQDVFTNIKLLETAVSRVSAGGRAVWVSGTGEEGGGAGAGGGGVFSGAVRAFDDTMRLQFEQIVTQSQCEAVWLGRHNDIEHAAASVIAALVPSEHSPSDQQPARSSFRTQVVKISNTLWRWLKTIT